MSTGEYLREFIQATHKSHIESGSIIWVWSIKSKMLIWTVTGYGSIWVNRRKIKIKPSEEIGIHNHADMLDQLFKIDPELEKSLYPWMKNSVTGRITGREREIVIYDQREKRDRDIDKAIDAIYKYIKE